MKSKICIKCGKEYSATLEYFYPDKRLKSKLRSRCKKCHQEYGQSEAGKHAHRKYYQRHSEQIKEQRKQYCQQHHIEIKKYQKKYYQTLNGYLRCVFRNIKRRCTNPKHRDYRCYGGRGIKCLFVSNEFVSYVINDLGITDINQIKGLQIDREDNNGHYEKGNIRFVTAKQNANNRRDNVHKNTQS